MSADVSILIAGAGPVGLTLAVELARRGFRPRVVDRDEGTMALAESRALSVNARTLALLSPSGITAAILAEALPLREFRMTAGQNRLLTVRTQTLAGPFPALSILPQGYTERILLTRLREFGIEPEWNTVVANTVGDAAAPELTLVRQGENEHVRPDILIGTDGSHSVIRKGYGFGFPGNALETHFYLADYRYAEPVDTSFGEANFLHPGVLGRLPVRPDVLRFLSTLEDFESRIVHPAPVLEQTWKSDFRISFRHVAEMSRGRVFLAGAMRRTCIRQPARGV